MKTRNERVKELSELLVTAGYEISAIEFLIDDNQQDEENALQKGMPALKLTLSLKSEHQTSD